MEKKKVLIIGSSKFPIPAVQGGAVPYLIEELIQEQCDADAIELYCCSLCDIKAVKKSKEYTNTNFIWAKVPKYIHFLDKTNTWIIKTIFRQNRLQSIGFLMQVVWFAFFVGNVLNQNNFDVLVFENSVPMLFSLKLHSNHRKYAGKYYIHMHSVPRKYYGNKKIFSNCKGLISISEYVAKEILKDYRISITNEQIKLMYNCIDTELMKPLNQTIKHKIKEEYGIKDGETVFLFAGRLCKEKGIEEVIKTIMSLDLDNYKLLIVGANFYSSGIMSSYESYLKALSSPIKSHIIFTGYVEYEKMVFLYNIADIVLLPSIWEEPAGMTIIEAMACKRPVVTTRSGGIPEYVSNNSCILLDKDENIILSLKEAILNILTSNDFKNQLSNNAYERAKLFNRKYYYKQFINIILEDKNNEKI